MDETPAVDAAQGSGGLCCGNQSGAVAREAYCGLWEPFDGAVPWWGARGATAGGSHLGGLEMGNEA